MRKYLHGAWQKILQTANMIAAQAKEKRVVRVFLMVASTTLLLIIFSALLEKSQNTAPAVIFSSLLLVLAITYFNARNRPTATALILIALSLIIAPFLQGVMSWFRLLGTDSLSEIQSFEWEEALYLIGTFNSLFSLHETIVRKFIPMFLPWLVVGGLAFYLFTRYRQVYVYAVKHIVFSLALLWVFYASYQLHSIFVGNITIRNIITQDLQVHDVVVSRSDLRPRRVIVYIGESTSALHMSLYGYPRLTTPQLDKLANEEGFILFHHTLSLHTHTSESLVEAFTIDIPTHKKIQTFGKSKKRLSVIDALNRGDIDTVWMSTQERSGTWNLASSVIGAGASQKSWALETKTRLLGNIAFTVERPDDLTFFVREMDNVTMEKDTAVFLHSYVGHGGERNIKSEETWQDFISNMPIYALYGRHGKKRIQSIHENYDHDIKYVDNTISTIISRYVSSKKEPTIFIYFSDHGESIFSGHGHDSSRFTFDMAAVPFFIYFNASARRQFSDKYRRLKNLAGRRQPMTLDSVPEILAFLFDVKIESQDFSMGPDLAPITLPPAITVRDTVSGPTAVFLGGETFSDNHHPIRRANDSATDLYVAKHIMLGSKHNDGEVCTHAANNLGRALVGLLASNCIEIDIVVQDDGAIDVYHPPNKNIGLRLEDVWESVSRHDGALWLDSKNIKQPEACEHLRAFLEARVRDDHKPRSILVEFPPPTDFDNPAIRTCAERITHLVKYVTYYVPTQLGLTCTKTLSDGVPAEESPPCLSLREKIDKALSTRIIADISFDYRLLPAVESLGYNHKRVRFHTWHVSAARLDTIPYEKFRFIIAR